MRSPSVSWFDRSDLNKLFARVRAPVGGAAMRSLGAAPAAVRHEPPPMPRASFDEPPRVEPPRAPRPRTEPPPVRKTAPPRDGDGRDGDGRAETLVRLTRLVADRHAEPGEIFQQIARAAAQELGALSVSLWRPDESGLLICLQNYDVERDEHGIADELTPEQHGALISALRAGELVVGSSEDPRARAYLGNHTGQARSLAAVPIQVDGRLQAAVLATYGAAHPLWRPRDSELVEALGDLLLLSLERAMHRHRARAQADADRRILRQTEALGRLNKSKALGDGDLYTALREITAATSETLDLERCSVWLYNADKTAILCMDLYQRKTDVHESGVELTEDAFPEYFEALKEERFIAAHDAHTDPRTACFSESYLTPLGINSMLDAPIRVGGRMIGVVCNEQVGPHRQWTQDEQTFAGSIADCVSLAIESSERRQAEIRLHQVLSELQLGRS